MATETFWAEFWGSCRKHRQRVASALDSAGLRYAELDGASPPAAPGVVFFEALDDELCAFVDEASRRGLNRLLAVQVGESNASPWLLLRHGAADVVPWDPSGTPAEDIRARFERWRVVDALLTSDAVRRQLVGESPAMTRVLRGIVEVARFTDAFVLLTGESGTGKELAARLIHDLDARADKPELVVVDCTTVVPDLSGSEFFGHERGAFTGAIAPRTGAFEFADGGTLFLDEVGELPLPLQAELLRVVQEGVFKRVGSNAWKSTSFRLVSATNRELREEESSGRFRLDLLHRISAWSFRLPALRERAEDIVPLAQHFLVEHFPADACPEISPPVREFLLTREYPGNVRELRHVVSRIAQRHVGAGPLTAGDIPAEDRPEMAASPERFESDLRRGIGRALAGGAGLREIGQRAAEIAIDIALAKAAGSVRLASEALGVTPRALQLRRASRRTRDDGGDVAGDGDRDDDA